MAEDKNQERKRKERARKDEQRKQRQAEQEEQAAQEERATEESSADSSTEESSNEREVKSPRDLSKRPPSEASEAGPKHVRLGEHGIRTTAETQDELREEAHEENIREDYERSKFRTTGAGPNPYTLPTSREQAGEELIEELLEDRDNNDADNSLLSEQALASFAASSATSDAEDAEVQTLGATVTDTGQKIVMKPERVDAQERAVLPKAGTPHEEATKEAGEDEMTADKNPGAIFGGTVKDRA